MSQFVVTLITTVFMIVGLASAQTKPFYEGKTLRVIVGSGSGAGNDIRTRFWARHAVRHIAGNPTIIVQNMPGAGGLQARNYLFNVAKPDGLTIAEILRGTAFREVIEDPGVAYKSAKFNWLGNLTTAAPVCVLRIDRGETLEEAIKRSAQTPLRVGESGASEPGAAVALLLSKFTGLNLTVVAGYPGGAAINLAMERDEVHMRCGLVWSSAKVTRRQWFKRLGSPNPFASVIVQGSPARLADLSDVPTLMELAPDVSWRLTAEIVTSTYQNAYPMLAPPGVPKDLVKLLRDAFWATVNDPEYLAEAKKMGFVDDKPLRGETVQELKEKLIATPEEPRRHLRKLLGLAS